MLSILLFILKIIGILILALLGLIVVLSCIILFLPLKYHGVAKKKESFKEMYFSVKASWFFHLFCIHAVYEHMQFSYNIRFLFKTYKSERESDVEFDLQQEEVKTVSRGNPSGEVKGVSAAHVKTETVKEIDRPIGIQMQSLYAEDEEIPTHERIKSKRKKRRKPLQYYCNKLVVRLKKIIAKLKYTFHNICVKMKMVFSKKEQLQDFIELPVHREAFTKTKKELLRLLGRLKPNTLKGTVLFGYDEPYLTGKTLAWLSIVYPFIGNYVDITPDFENAILEGELLLKGKIRVIFFVIAAWNLFWDKSIRASYKDINKIIN